MEYGLCIVFLDIGKEYFSCLGYTATDNECFRIDNVCYDRKSFTKIFTKLLCNLQCNRIALFYCIPDILCCYGICI